MSSSIDLDLRASSSGPPVALVTIRRPQRRNALDTPACAELLGALRSAADQDARALVLTGAEGSFCAGADLGTVRDQDFGPALRAVLEALCELPIVCIAAVDGPALGAGVQLAVSCDLRVATPLARFGVPAGKLGLMVDHWTIKRVSLMAGQGPARAMLLGGELLSGDEALRLGLVQRAGGLDQAMAWAGEIAALAPLSLAGHKLALNRLEAPTEDPVVGEARDRAWASLDLDEGITAFRERRAPRFRGR